MSYEAGFQFNADPESELCFATYRACSRDLRLSLSDTICVAACCCSLRLDADWRFVRGFAHWSADAPRAGATISEALDAVGCRLYVRWSSKRDCRGRDSGSPRSLARAAVTT